MRKAVFEGCTQHTRHPQTEGLQVKTYTLSAVRPPTGGQNAQPGSPGIPLVSSLFLYSPHSLLLDMPPLTEVGEQRATALGTLRGRGPVQSRMK